MANFTVTQAVGPREDRHGLHRLRAGASRRRRGSVSTLDFKPICAALRCRLRTYLNTGFVAIHHLHDSGVALFGMTFLREPHFAGYPGDGAAHWPADGAPPTRIWNHGLAVQYRHFADLCRWESRLAADHVPLAVMPEVRSALAARASG